MSSSFLCIWHRLSSGAAIVKVSSWSRMWVSIQHLRISSLTEWAAYFLRQRRDSALPFFATLEVLRCTTMPMLACSPLCRFFLYFRGLLHSLFSSSEDCHKIGRYRSIQLGLSFIHFFKFQGLLLDWKPKCRLRIKVSFNLSFQVSRVLLY